MKNKKPLSFALLSTIVTFVLYLTIQVGIRGNVLSSELLIWTFLSSVLFFFLMFFWVKTRLKKQE